MIWIIHFSVINILLMFSKLMKKNNVFIIGTFVYSVFTFGQRWMTGVDFPGYLLYYLIDFSGVEPGYYFLQNILANNNIYFGILVFIVFTLTTFNFYRLILKVNVNPALMIYLYSLLEIYFIQMSQIRQMIAVSFFVNSFYYVYNNKKVKSVTNFLLALSFHSSVVVAIPFLFIRPKFSKKNIFFIVLILSVFPLIDINFFINLFNINLYSYYTNSVYDVPLGISHYFRFYISLLGTLIYVYHLYNPDKSGKYYCIVNAQILYLLFYSLSFQYAPVFRIANYFKIFEIIFFIGILNKLKNISRKKIINVILLFVFLMYTSIAFLDPYDITRYEFRPLMFKETRTTSELIEEINSFHSK